jgi:hypothetical protein
VDFKDGINWDWKGRYPVAINLLVLPLHFATMQKVILYTPIFLVRFHLMAATRTLPLYGQGGKGFV